MQLGNIGKSAHRRTVISAFAHTAFDTVDDLLQTISATRAEHETYIRIRERIDRIGNPLLRTSGEPPPTTYGMRGDIHAKACRTQSVGCTGNEGTVQRSGR